MPDADLARATGRLVRCTSADVARLAEIRRAREQWMAGRGIVQWPVGSLDEVTLRAQVARGEWCGLVEQAVGQAADGAATTLRAGAAPLRTGTALLLAEHAPLRAAARLLDEDPEFWDGDVTSALYVHGLMVALEAAGCGLGERVLDLAAEEGRRRGREVLRLDCAPHLLGYYRRQGFDPVREKVFPEFTTVLLERRLSPAQA